MIDRGRNMPSSPVRSLIEHICRAVPPEGDGELLGRFVERRDETALAALVKRHGPMVWGVCRRLLGHHDAEDAFQATFVVLVRKAASVKPREMVGNWLYGVARQAALQVKAAKRRAREIQVTQMPDVEAPQDRWADVRPILDEELSRLPDKYRAVIVLCDLEGRTRREVARQFGCPEGTVASRLARAREMLAKRLARRGVALSVGVLAAVLSQNVASAVPSSVVSSTIKAATLVAAGQAAILVKVAAVTEGVLKAMLVSKLKAAIAVVLVVGFLTIGATVLTSRTASAQDDKNPAAEKTVEPAPKANKEGQAAKKSEAAEPLDIMDMGKSDLLEEAKEAVTAWGEDVDGLQMGLAQLPKDTHTVRQGEKARFVVKLRNVGKADIKATYVRLRERQPTVTDAGGGRVKVAMPPSPRYYAAVIERVLKPDEIIILYGPEIAVQPEDPKMDGEVRVDTPTIFAKPSKYKIAYGGLLASHPKLTTGTVEVEVKEPAKPVAKNDVAWGKEVDGLQAGLVADASTCRQDEKLKLTVKLRNVGKAEVTVTYGVLRECAPQVTTGTGGRVSVHMPPPFDNYAVPTKRTLKPDETITLYNPEVAVEPEDPVQLLINRKVDTPTICVEPGKYKIAYGGMIQSHPKLTTGTVDFEVMDQVAWGKEAGGLQAGIVGPGAVRIGEKSGFTVKLRNVSKETIKVSAWPLWTCYPGVVDPRGKRVPTTKAPAVNFEIIPKALTLKPGEMVDVGRSDLLVAEPDQKVTVPEGVVDFCAIHVTPGKYIAGCVGFLKENHTLATATVEFGVKPASVTAWGKEVGGLQAGLRMAEKRAYHAGETVRLVVRVRNVGKEEVTFRYVRQFFLENPPAVTDGKGKSVPLERVSVFGFHALVPVNLAPGKEIEVGERQLELKPTLFGTGKFSVQYEQLETPENDMTLSKLATGKLVLEVKSEQKR
jgi:RNA polymerase sigma factor (sigma-70 family)